MVPFNNNSNLYYYYYYYYHHNSVITITRAHLSKFSLALVINLGLKSTKVCCAFCLPYQPPAHLGQCIDTQHILCDGEGLELLPVHGDR